MAEDSLRPSWIRTSVAEVDFERLSALGRDCVLLDVDNTIARQGGLEIESSVVEKLAEARRRGWIHKMCLVSNVTLGRRRIERVEGFGRQLGCPVVTALFWECKPAPPPYLRALEWLQASASSAAFVGDQIFTDIAGANRLGIFTVLVRPFSPDALSTTLTGRRRREARLLAAWNHKGSRD